jgi:hypothetical protein
MRGHDNKFVAFRSGHINDRGRSSSICTVSCATSSAFCNASGDLRRFVGLSRNFRFVLGGRVLYRRRFEGTCTIRTYDHDECNCGSNSFGQGDAMLGSFVGKLRTVGRYEDLPVYSNFLLVPIMK